MLIASAPSPSFLFFSERKRGRGRENTFISSPRGLSSPPDTPCKIRVLSLGLQFANPCANGYKWLTVVGRSNFSARTFRGPPISAEDRVSGGGVAIHFENSISPPSRLVYRSLFTFRFFTRAPKLRTTALIPQTRGSGWRRGRRGRRPRVYIASAPAIYYIPNENSTPVATTRLAISPFTV